MASIRSEHAPRPYWRMPSRLSWRADLGGTISRVRALFADGSDSSLARRLAGAAFLIRVAGALLAFISQILLARWMGGVDFGNMLGERRSCALVYASSFFIDLILCLALIPRFGIARAAIANAVALIFESASPFCVAKYRLGLPCLVFGPWQR